MRQITTYVGNVNYIPVFKYSLEALAANFFSLKTLEEEKWSLKIEYYPQDSESNKDDPLLRLIYTNGKESETYEFSTKGTRIKNSSQSIEIPININFLDLLNFLLNMDKKTAYSIPIIANNLKRVIESGKAGIYKTFLEDMSNLFDIFYFSLDLRYISIVN